MTPTQMPTVMPPTNYPHGDKWAPEGDYFHVPEQLRHWYASDEAAPQSQHVRGIYSASQYGEMGSHMVPLVTVDGKGHCTQAPPHEDQHLKRGSVAGGWRERQVAPDPARPADLPYQTWEHLHRLGWAREAAGNQERADRRYAIDLLHACCICGNQGGGARIGAAWYGSGSLCALCREAVKVRAAERHAQRFSAEVDAYLDGQVPEWVARPPERNEATSSHCR